MHFRTIAIAALPALGSPAVGPPLRFVLKEIGPGVYAAIESGRDL